MKINSSLLFLLFFISLISGCQSHLKEPSPVVPHPEKWTNIQELQTNIQEEILWWKLFKDPILTELIQRALKENLTLKATIAQVHQARAQLLIADASLYPLIDLSGSATHNRTSSTVPHSVASGSSYDLFMGGFDASWELDFFGKIHYGEKAALASFQSQVESLHAARLTLIGEIAQNYILLRSAQQQLQVIESSLQKWKDLYQLTLDLEKSGLQDGIIVAQTKSSLDQSLASLQPLQATIKNTIHQLSVLTGSTPTSLYERLLPLSPIPQMPQKIFVGLPSDLLKRRPDIRKILRDLEAAIAQVGVVQADLFPQFSLTGSIGYESDKGSTLFKTKSLYSSFGPSFSWPIFDFGRVRANIQVQEAVQEELSFQYKNIVLQAFADVETALVSLSTETSRLETLKQALSAAKTVADLNDNRFRLGQEDFLTVLQARLTVDTSALTLIQSQATLALNTIALYKALGGGWQDPSIKL